MASETTASTTTQAPVTVKPTQIPLNIEQKCPIQYVTVYNDRAEVTRSVKHLFAVEGPYDLVFDGFSPHVDLTSLHVSGGTGKACTILEVSYQTRHENQAPDSGLASLNQLEKEFSDTQAELGKHQRELARLAKQRSWLDGRAAKLMNQEEKSSEGGNLEIMQRFLEFYYENLKKLDEETVNEEAQIKQVTLRLNEIQSKINQYGSTAEANRRKTTREVTVTVHISSSNVEVALEISYLISNCSWSASYDVRVNSKELERQKTQLTYYGSIVNQSQENWPDVQLSLSTATPSLGGAPPKLATLKVAYEAPKYNYPMGGLPQAARFSSAARTLSMRESIMPRMRALTSLSSSTSADQLQSDSPSTINVLATQTEASMSSASFSIPRRSTIDADGKPHKVTIGVLDLTSTFTYVVIPKISPHAYLKATTTNTSDKQLLAGPASVFMDNNFITHSTIDNVCLGDTFDLPLGTDASVKVEYKPVRKVTDTQGLISKVSYENVRHETRLVNTKATEIIVYVHEQVPLSSDEKIKVKLTVPDLRVREQGPYCTVTMNESNNLEWKCVLPARAECRCPLEYNVEWPKDKRVEYKEN